MKKRIIKTFLCIICLMIGCLFISSCGKKKFNYPDNFMIDVANNHIDMQDADNCAGFAAAYIIRSLGDDVDGKTVHKYFVEHPDGGVTPFALVDGLNSHGYKAKYQIGSIDELKYIISKGKPVIAFMKYSRSNEALHFLPVVGYDENSIYAADSLTGNVKNDNYNRIISVDEFNYLWDIGFPKYNYMYITIEK